MLLSFKVVIHWLSAGGFGRDIGLRFELSEFNLFLETDWLIRSCLLHHSISAKVSRIILEITS
jgi:hypothetical protein